MHEHCAASVEAFLDESIGGNEILEQVLVLDVVHLDQ